MLDYFQFSFVKGVWISALDCLLYSPKHSSPGAHSQLLLTCSGTREARREMLSFAEFGTAAGARFLLGKFGASCFIAIASLILHLRTISESSGSSVLPASRDFPFSWRCQSPLVLESPQSSIFKHFEERSCNFTKMTHSRANARCAAWKYDSFLLTFYAWFESIVKIVKKKITSNFIFWCKVILWLVSIFLKQKWHRANFSSNGVGCAWD